MHFDVSNVPHTTREQSGSSTHRRFSCSLDSRHPDESSQFEIVSFCEETFLRAAKIACDFSVSPTMNDFLQFWSHCCFTQLNLHICFYISCLLFMMLQSIVKFHFWCGPNTAFQLLLNCPCLWVKHVALVGFPWNFTKWAFSDSFFKFLTRTRCVFYEAVLCLITCKCLQIKVLMQF